MTEYLVSEGACPRRDFKDTLFRLIFREKESLLSLYNAVNNTDYTNPDDLEIVTLENAIYMDMKNDVAFVLYDELHLYEHQSTPNPNMPLRDLFYIAREYEKLLAIPEYDNLQRSVYSTRKLELPAPVFMVFYNGRKNEPEYSTMKISDLYRKKNILAGLELVVHTFNINLGMNHELLERCTRLSDYAKYVDRVRKYAILVPIEEAVECAVRECIAEGILADILTKYRREVIQMSIFEFDAEREWAIIRRDERLNALDELRAENSEIVKEIKAQYKAEYEAELDTLKNQYEAELDEFKTQYEAKHEAELDEFKTQYEAKHEAELDKLKEQLATQHEQQLRKVCEKVRKESLVKGHTEGALLQMFQLVHKKLLTAEVAAAELGMSEQEFVAKMEQEA